MTQLEAIQLLRTCDHSFLSPDGVREITEPFGFVGTTYTARATPNDIKGLTLNDDRNEAEGQDAHIVARQIADHLGLTYKRFFGVGTQLRHVCEVIEAYVHSLPSK